MEVSAMNPQGPTSSSAPHTQDKTQTKSQRQITGLTREFTKLAAVMQGVRDELKQDRLDRQHQSTSQGQQQHRSHRSSQRQPPPLMDDEYDHYQNYPPYGGYVDLGVPGSRAYNESHNIPQDSYVPPHRRQNGPPNRRQRSAPAQYTENEYTQDGLPICNSCHAPGHIARFCRVRQAQRQAPRQFRAPATRPSQNQGGR